MIDVKFKAGVFLEILREREIDLSVNIHPKYVIGFVFFFFKNLLNS